MEIGEEQMPRLQEGDLLRLRLLHLHDHVAPGEGRGGVGGDARAGVDIVLVVEVDTEAGPRLDDHLMAGARQLGDRGRGQSDPIFVILDLFGNADAHIRPLKRGLRGPIAACIRFVAVAEAPAAMLEAAAFPS